MLTDKHQCQEDLIWKIKKKTVGLATPEGDNDAATKKYVDDNKPDLSNYLKLDGEKTMKGILNMDSHKITNVYMDYTSGTDSGRKYWKNKEFQKKDWNGAIAFTNYEKVVVELRSALRGDEFNENEFIDKMKIMDEMIIDKTPSADRFVKKYQKKYLNYK